MSDAKRAVRVGIIGIGNMGMPMSTNLLKAGYTVTAFDRTQDRLEALVSRGARRAGSIAEVVGESDVVFTSLPNDAVFRQVALGAEGVVNSANSNIVYMDTSTVSPAVSAEVAVAAAQRGLRYLRTTVS
jgi:3-hydroxyisobutyrate dehydrogenase-like beta-hydroxyacid dehydrogenase